MIKGVIFDMDGTLTLSEQLHHKAFAAVFKDYDVDFTLEDEVKRFAGSGSRFIFPTDTSTADCVRGTRGWRRPGARRGRNAIVLLVSVVAMGTTGYHLMRKLEGEARA